MQDRRHRSHAGGGGASHRNKSHKGKNTRSCVSSWHECLGANVLRVAWPQGFPTSLNSGVHVSTGGGHITRVLPSLPQGPLAHAAAYGVCGVAREKLHPLIPAGEGGKPSAPQREGASMKAPREANQESIQARVERQGERRGRPEDQGCCKLGLL